MVSPRCEAVSETKRVAIVLCSGAMLMVSWSVGAEDSYPIILFVPRLRRSLNLIVPIRVVLSVNLVAQWLQLGRRSSVRSKKEVVVT
jgi:hypothetical protein